jgi:hypothetical protein
MVVYRTDKLSAENLRLFSMQIATENDVTYILIVCQFLCLSCYDPRLDLLVPKVLTVDRR